MYAIVASKWFIAKTVTSHQCLRMSWVLRQKFPKSTDLGKCFLSLTNHFLHFEDRPPHYLLSSCPSESAESKFIKQFITESLVSVAELLFFIPIIALFLSNSNNRETPPFNPVGVVHRGQQQPHGVEVQLFLTQPLASSRTRQPITPVASGITHGQLHGEARSQSIGPTSRFVTTGKCKEERQGWG